MRNWKEVARSVRSRTEEAGFGGGVTLVEVLGTGRVLVEHHKGILGYGDEEIIVGATFGLVCIRGKELRLCCMSREQLFIAGQIREIALDRRNG